LSQILSLVALEITELETAIGRVQREINLVREYRARLIVDVVTGKLDVREASANLPEEPEETEELEEAESADGEFEDEEAESEADTAEVLV
jgi:type I restriction enzyme S subunit